MGNEFKLFASWEELRDGRAVRQRALVGVYDSHAGALRGIVAHQGALGSMGGAGRFVKGFEIEGDCWQEQLTRGGRVNGQ
jgi:hypothetical protein